MTLKRLSGRTRGFTLVEILIVLLLIAILMALIIPNFFGARQKAGDRVAQQTLKSAVTAAKSVGTDTDSFALVDAESLQQVEPNVEFVPGTGPSSQVGDSNRSVSVLTDADSSLVLTAMGEDGACWVVELNYGADTTGNSLPDRYGVTEQTCAANSLTLGTVEWGTDVRSQSFPDRSLLND